MSSYLSLKAADTWNALWCAFCKRSVFTLIHLCCVNAVTTGDANLDCTYYSRDQKPVVYVQRAVR